MILGTILAVFAYLALGFVVSFLHGLWKFHASEQDSAVIAVVWPVLVVLYVVMGPFLLIGKLVETAMDRFYR